MLGEAGTFGVLLKKARTRAGLSQRRLAEISGISERQISDQERGLHISARNDTIQALADTLHLTAGERERFERAGRNAGQPATMFRFRQLIIPPTPLIGRARLVQQTTAMLGRPGTRIVTLTGPGGVGKTRLAAAAAHLAAGAFPGGGHDVDLAVLSDPHQIATHIGHALGAKRARDAEALASYIGDRRILLLLDNFEHLLEAAPVVSVLVARCPGLSVLATSREPLRVRGEHEFEVPPLAVPGGDERTAADIAPVAAVELFAWHAGAIQGWELTDADAPAVAAICQHLDGMPLAIELAAAQTRTMPVRAIAERLGDHLALDVLTDGPRDAPARQRTLSATIGWSHDLLGAALQRLLHRLAVFPSDWTREAAEHVAGDLGPGSVLPGLGALTACHLVVALPGDRFRMYETVQEFAAAALAADGQTAATEARHTSYVLGVIETDWTGLRGPDRPSWLDAVESVHDDVRAALARALGDGDQWTAVRIAGAMWRFWYDRGHLAEGDRWLGLALEAGTLRPADDTQAHFLARALNGRGATSQYLHSDPRLPRACYRRARELRQEAGDMPGVASALGNLALIEQYHGDPGDAERLYQEANACFRACGDDLGLAAQMSNLGTLLVARGRHAEAAQAFAAALATFQEHGDETGAAYTLLGQASLASASGQPAAAAALAEESRAMFAELRNPIGGNEALLALAQARAAQQDAAGASELLAQVLAAARAMEDQWNAAAALRAMAELAAHGGDPGAADLARQALSCYRAVGYRAGIAAAQELLAALGTPNAGY